MPNKGANVIPAGAPVADFLAPVVMAATVVAPRHAPLSLVCGLHEGPSGQVEVWAMVVAGHMPTAVASHGAGALRQQHGGQQE